MGKNSLNRLAGELKHFLLEQDEDEFITPAAPTKTAAGVSRADKKLFSMQENTTLTVDFPRAQHVATDTAPLPDQTKETPVMTTSQKQTALNELAQTINQCSRCPLGATRLHAVPGEGNVDADLMFVGEGPGYDEDRQGRPFVGRAGQLLDKMIAAMGLTREQVFIANIAKCHPMTDPQHPEKHGNDRAPNAGEIACCRKYLEQQIAIICPKYIVALGGVSAKALISDAKSLGALRGQFYNLTLDSVQLPRPVQVLATFHPAALLRNPNWKKDAWKDLQMVMAKLGLKTPVK
ncbi:MAG: uracil-DNA glycosylase [Elusimicrobiaceae bacterium]|nr:uracil-DNA glycosylase [Elusimicrobiaceae bacterium]